MTVITRFAPSPTGFLHIGGARTALFNWLFARNQGGKFLLRVEDTDHARSTQEAKDAILDGLRWLGIDWDDEVVYQSERTERHKEIAQQLIDQGKAYYCYCSKEELDDMRSKAEQAKQPFRYDRRWRDKTAADAPEGIDPVVRLKAPLEGKTIIDDAVQGKVVVPNETLDDLVLLRSDGTPTYMLAVVVDDYDMGVTHAIRGDDHLTNASRQAIIYHALGWDLPVFAHIPLIHGSDGAKLSKRHGALGVEAYRDMGYLPAGLRNYLLRLGWSHGDDEIISTEQAIGWFNIEGLGKSPSRLDIDKMNSVNTHYINEADDDYLLHLVLPHIEGATNPEQERILRGMTSLKQRAKTIVELAEQCVIYKDHFDAPFTDKAKKALEGNGSAIIGAAIGLFESIELWEHDPLFEACSNLAEKNELKLGKVMAPIRAAITHSHASPSMFEVMEILGKDVTISRLKAQ